MKGMKKILSLALALAMAITLAPVSVKAQEAAHTDSYHDLLKDSVVESFKAKNAPNIEIATLYVGGQKVVENGVALTSGNLKKSSGVSWGTGGSVKYDADDNVLYLNKAIITGKTWNELDGLASALFYEGNSPLTIVATGTNKISVTGKKRCQAVIPVLTLARDDSLSPKLIIKSAGKKATINVSGSVATGVTVPGSYGMFVGGLELESVKVYSKSAPASAASTGVYVDSDIVSKDSTLSGTGNYVTLKGDCLSIGICVDDGNIITEGKNNVLTGKVVTSTKHKGMAFGIFAVSSNNGQLEIHGQVTGDATGASSASDTAGIIANGLNAYEGAKISAKGKHNGIYLEGSDGAEIGFYNASVSAYSKSYDELNEIGPFMVDSSAPIVNVNSTFTLSCAKAGSLVPSGHNVQGLFGIKVSSKYSSGKDAKYVGDKTPVPDAQKYVSFRPATVKVSDVEYKTDGTVTDPAPTAKVGTTTIASPSVNVVGKTFDQMDLALGFASGSKMIVGSKNVTIAIRPSRVENLKVVSDAKKSVHATWTLPEKEYQGGNEEFQIRYSTSSSLSNAKTVTVPAGTDFVDITSGLKSGTTYYFQIAGTSYGKQSYWSKSVKVKVK